MKFIKTIMFIVCMGVFIQLLSSCEKTDEYYEGLKLQPELMKSYHPLYTIGEIMVIEGRFSEPNLSIKIGNAVAKIEKIEKSMYQVDYGYTDSLYRVSVRIAKEMGVGAERPIYITSSGIQIEGPSIEIIEDAQSGILKGELTVTKIADYPLDSDPIYCRSGKGNLYFLDKNSFVINRMDTEGDLTKVFEMTELLDSDGQSFAFTRINGIGIDPNERYAYISLYSQATGSQENHFYRLIRYDIQEKSSLVLNKTAYHRIASKRTLQAVQPFEGDISKVKIFGATGIYPDREGNVYLDIEKRFITRLSKDGKYKYLMKNGEMRYRQPIDPAPQVIDPNTGAYYSEIRLAQLFPGVITTDNSISDIVAFNPDYQEYWFDDFYLNTRIVRNDLVNQITVNSFSGTGVMQPIPYISGSFKVLSGFNDRVVQNNSLWGNMPLGKGKLLILYYQNIDKGSDFPAWGILDFEQETGYRYAPGIFDAKEYEMTTTDLLLNYDQDGMLLMTANNRSAILKTIYK